MSLKSKLESLLFVSLKPLAPRDLISLTNAKSSEIEEALQDLMLDYQNNKRGLSLVKNNNCYQLTTSGDNADLVQKFLHLETTKELSVPSLEALTIIAYRGPIAKLELEKIRGINCSLILRNLLLRGLIEEKSNKDKNEKYYIITHKFLHFLGLNNISNLPDYEKLHVPEPINQEADISVINS
jgi:segregation and condensation protein B